MIQLSQAEYEALVADAMRYRGLRAISIEPDEALQEQFLDIADGMIPEDAAGLLTPAGFDALVDRAIVACDAVRCANATS